MYKKITKIEVNNEIKEIKRLIENKEKTRVTIMRGLEVKKGILDNCKIIDCKNEKSNKLYKKIWENDICFCGSGLKVKKCHNGLNEDSLVGNLIKIYYELDNIIQSKIDCICQEGCSECCSDYFYISEEEFLVIMDYMIRNFGEKEINKVKLKAKEYIMNIKKNYISEYEKLNTVIKSDEKVDYEMLITREHSFKIPCVFLKDGKCSIYAVRPFICRFYGTRNKDYSCNKVCINKSDYDEIEMDNILIEKRINSEFKKIIGQDYIERGYLISDFIYSMYEFNLESGKYKVATEKNKKDYVMMKAKINNLI